MVAANTFLFKDGLVSGVSQALIKKILSEGSISDNFFFKVDEGREDPSTT